MESAQMTGQDASSSPRPLLHDQLAQGGQASISQMQLPGAVSWQWCRFRTLDQLSPQKEDEANAWYKLAVMSAGSLHRSSHVQY
ncbi:hypothetical protein SAMD00023353_9000260 [Rosellinia necatrix]|uniref:Uncharacterized protein n=1 Tax=Rosellinia necatrix TaxID=77044 RepID=A0A1S8AB37_ROSNE|nr:hypothetical protein SAMD00023353_9000260 [Rosellinia necatrix]